MNVYYEFAAACTSIVMDGEEDGLPIHGRTMDWGMMGLQDFVINVDFVKVGEGGRRGRCMDWWVGRERENGCLWIDT